MDFFGLTMFSIVMALIGYFKPGPLTAIQPVSSIPERLQEGFRKDHTLGHFGGIIDKIFPIVHGNDSFMNPELQRDTPSIPATVVVPTSEPVDSVVNTPFDNLTASGFVSTVADWDGLDPWFSGYAHQRFEPISNFLQFAGFSTPDPLFIKNLIKVTGLLGLPVILVSVGVVISNFWRHLQTADGEVIEFTKAVRSKRASLLHRLDLAAFVLDKQLDQIAKHITLEQERVHEELASFRPGSFIGQEVNAFREAYELHAQSEFDRQTTQTNDFLQELEQARQVIPNLANIRAQYDEFQEMLRQSKEAYGKLDESLKRIEGLSNSFAAKESKAPPVSQDIAAPISEGKPATLPMSSDEELSQSKTGEECVHGDARSKSQSEKREPSTPLVQWVMASARRAMTPQEIDDEWKVRRERAIMRRANMQA